MQNCTVKWSFSLPPVFTVWRKLRPPQPPPTRLVAITLISSRYIIVVAEVDVPDTNQVNCPIRLHLWTLNCANPPVHIVVLLFPIRWEFLTHTHNIHNGKLCSSLQSITKPLL